MNGKYFPRRASLASALVTALGVTLALSSAGPADARRRAVTPPG
jgi:hypothetical protein